MVAVLAPLSTKTTATGMVRVVSSKWYATLVLTPISVPFRSNLTPTSIQVAVRDADQIMGVLYPYKVLTVKESIVNHVVVTVTVFALYRELISVNS